MSGKIPSDAFEYYVSLGPGRSYRSVAEHYEVTKRAVTKHAAREGWAERLDKIEQEAREGSDLAAYGASSLDDLTDENAQSILQKLRSAVIRKDGGGPNDKV